MCKYYGWEMLRCSTKIFTLHVEVLKPEKSISLPKQMDDRSRHVSNSAACRSYASRSVALQRRSVTGLSAIHVNLCLLHYSLFFLTWPLSYPKTDDNNIEQGQNPGASLRKTDCVSSTNQTHSSESQHAIRTARNIHCNCKADTHIKERPDTKRAILKEYCLP